MLTGGLLSARSVELEPGLQPVLRSESVGIADGRGRSQRCKECRRSCKNISWSYYLPQSSPVSRISASQPLRGPLWALRFNILAPAMQRRRHPSLQPGPALPPAHELLELVVLRPPGFPVMPGARGRQRTTTPSRLRSGSLRHRLPGTRVPRWRQTLDFKSQEASHIRFPGAGVAPRLPVCSALISFHDHHLLLREACPGRHIPECSRAGGGALSEVWGLVAYIPSPGGPALTGSIVSRSQRPRGHLRTGSHFSPGHLVSAALIGEWLPAISS